MPGWTLRVAGALLLCALVCGPQHRARAAEAATSPYLKGYKDFLSGLVPPEPGIYVRNDLFYYGGDIEQTVIGGRVAVGLKEWIVANVVAPTVVTPYKILAARTRSTWVCRSSAFAPRPI